MKAKIFIFIGAFLGALTICAVYGCGLFLLFKILSFFTSFKQVAVAALGFSFVYALIYVKRKCEEE